MSENAYGSSRTFTSEWLSKTFCWPASSNETSGPYWTDVGDTSLASKLGCFDACCETCCTVATSHALTFPRPLLFIAPFVPVLSQDFLTRHVTRPWLLLLHLIHIWLPFLQRPSFVSSLHPLLMLKVQQMGWPLSSN